MVWERKLRYKSLLLTIKHRVLSAKVLAFFCLRKKPADLCYKELWCMLYTQGCSALPTPNECERDACMQHACSGVLYASGRYSRISFAVTVKEVRGRGVVMPGPI
jgi:hypothetical protein